MSGVLLRKCVRCFTSHTPTRMRAAAGQGLISQLVNLLRQLASLWQTAILVTNGIVLPAYTSGVTPMGIRAALGSVWDRAPDVRLLLRRADDTSHVAAATTRSRTIDVQVLRHPRMVSAKSLLDSFVVVLH